MHRFSYQLDKSMRSSSTGVLLILRLRQIIGEDANSCFVMRLMLTIMKQNYRIFCLNQRYYTTLNFFSLLNRYLICRLSCTAAPSLDSNIFPTHSVCVSSKTSKLNARMGSSFVGGKRCSTHTHKTAANLFSHVSFWIVDCHLGWRWLHTTMDERGKLKDMSGCFSSHTIVIPSLCAGELIENLICRKSQRRRA